MSLQLIIRKRVQLRVLEEEEVERMSWGRVLRLTG